MVQMLVKAFVPVLNDQLGVYLPLIVVNCIILGRAEAFASKNGVLASAVDGLGMGIGFTGALFVMGAIREILGAGTFLNGISDLIGGSFNGFSIPFLNENPMLIFILAPGGFFVFGMVMALANKIAESKGKPKAVLHGCENCPMAKHCSIKDTHEGCEKKEAEA